MDRRAEIADGRLLLTMSPSGRHDHDIVQIRKRLARGLTGELVAATAATSETPPTISCAAPACWSCPPRHSTPG
ncbi:hypothetical protein [Phaeacidiphilus oryzae]|uniref:hypothetical protein n=1 Tax=Phaeacidiphilus oryzae TaxID=348818 RepID=UPI00056D90A0|nr:hypothetical protein [Phaeacidiphilus oryzae]